MLLPKRCLKVSGALNLYTTLYTLNPPKPKLRYSQSDATGLPPGLIFTEGRGTSTSSFSARGAFLGLLKGVLQGLLKRVLLSVPLRV